MFLLPVDIGLADNFVDRRNVSDRINSGSRLRVCGTMDNKVANK
jgi:hypothetical protein